MQDFTDDWFSLLEKCSDTGDAVRKFLDERDSLNIETDEDASPQQQLEAIGLFYVMASQLKELIGKRADAANDYLKEALEPEQELKIEGYAVRRSKLTARVDKTAWKHCLETDPVCLKAENQKKHWSKEVKRLKEELASDWSGSSITWKLDL